MDNFCINFVENVNHTSLFGNQKIPSHALPTWNCLYHDDIICWKNLIGAFGTKVVITGPTVYISHGLHIYSVKWCGWIAKTRIWTEKQCLAWWILSSFFSSSSLEDVSQCCSRPRESTRKVVVSKKAIWIARVVGRDRCLSTVCPWKNRPHGRCRQNKILASEPSQEPPTSPGLQISQTSVKGTECGYKPSDLQEDNRRKMPRNTVLEMSIRFGSVLPAIISFCSWMCLLRIRWRNRHEINKI